MITKAQITAASSTIDEIDLAMLTAVIRNSDKYKLNAAFYADLEAVIDDVDGSVQAQQLNAALSAISDLGIGMVEIDQRRVGGSDGLYYSQVLERNSLIEYMLGVLYPEPMESVPATYDANGNVIIGSDYRVAQRGE